MKFKFLLFILLESSILLAQRNYELSLAEQNKFPSGEIVSPEGSLLDAHYKPTYYRLEMFINPYQTTFTGKTTMYFEPTEPLNQVQINAKPNLQIQSISYRNQSITDFTHDGNIVYINLPHQIPQNQLDSISINFSGNSINASGVYLDQHDNVPVWSTLSEPFHASSWWVCKDDLLDKVDKLDVIVTHPDHMKAGSNGVIKSVQNIGGGFKKTHWQHNYAIPTYLIAISVTNYVEYNNSVMIGDTEVPIINYLYPESLAQWSSALDLVPSYISFFSDKWGDYPYKNEKYGHAQWNRNGGMEHSTMSFMGKFTFGLVGHELAHQWFGNLVTCASWSDIWINEGFAEYGDGMMTEQFLGDEEFRNWKDYNIGLIIAEPWGSVYNPEPENQSRTFNYRLSYAKGSMVVHGLRFAINDDELFYQALRDFLQNHAWGFASIQDFKTSLENSTGRDWSKYFADWIYGEGYPNISVQVNHSPSGYQVHFQQTPSHPSVTYFETPFEIEFKSADGQKLTQRFQLDSQSNSFSVELPFEVESFIPNPHFDVICKIENAVLNNQEVTINHSAQALIYPNPTQNEFTISHKEIIDEVTVFDSTGKIVLHTNPKKTLTEIRTQSWPKGVYMVQIQIGNKTQLSKVLVK